MGNEPGIPTSDFRVAYICGRNDLPNASEVVERAERSFLDYAPVAQTAVTHGRAAVDAHSGFAEEVARAVTDTMLRSPNARKLPAQAAQAEEEVEQVARTVAAQSRAEIERLVARFVSKGKPVLCLINWSPKKHWVSGEESAIDVAELVALRTLFEIHTAARQVYDPGVHFHLRVEDVEHAFMCAGDDGLEEDMGRYATRLNATVEILGLRTAFSVVRTASLARDSRELEAWHSRLEQNLSALRAYWYESERKGLDGFEQYETYQALERLGWRGQIPREMRDFYLGRIQRGRGLNAPTEDAAERALRNFAGILLHHQEHLLLIGDDTPVIVSFVTQPPGTPLHLALNRVSLKFAPSRLCRTISGAPPWSVKGCLHDRKGRLLPTFTSWRQPLGTYAQAIRGTFELAQGQLRVSVGADLLLHSKEKGPSSQERGRLTEPEAYV
jgi:hypothetical protein